MMQLKMHDVWAVLYICQEMVLRSQQPPEDGCWAPVSCNLGTKEAPWTPSGSTSHPSTWLAFFQWHMGGISGTLWVHKFNRTHGAEKKSYCRWKVAERCQLRCHTATIWLLCDAVFFFLTARRRHWENFNEKLKFDGALNGAPGAWKKGTAALLRQ
jgi:hypothetical protein